jgi:hypothetical protein
MQQRLNNFFDEVVGMLDDLHKRLIPQVRSLCKTGLIRTGARMRRGIVRWLLVPGIRHFKIKRHLFTNLKAIYIS